MTLAAIPVAGVESTKDELLADIERLLTKIETEPLIAYCLKRIRPKQQK